MNKWKKQQPPSYEYIGFSEPCWDIEDIVKIGKKKKICPYFASRDVSTLVEVIFCPYNYLVDPKIRSSVCFPYRIPCNLLNFYPQKNLR